MAEARRLLAGDPSTLNLLTAQNIPTQYKVVPTDATDVNTLRQLRDSLGDLPNVSKIVLADEQLDVISRLKGFVGLYTVILSVALLLAAILLIWNTIRTAMFARRARDRGDEARGSDGLVHPHPVHARGPDPRASSGVSSRRAVGSG